jgi:hypothetical protein
MNTSIVVIAGIIAVVAAILVLVAARHEPDTERQRTFARYVDTVNLLSVFVVVFAVYAIAADLSRFIVPERQRFGGGPGLLDVAEDSFSGSGLDSFVSRGNDAIWRGAVQATLVLVAAGVILAFHRRQRRAMMAWSGFDTSSGARVDLAYRYAVCFVAAFVILMAMSFGLYGLFRVVAPGVAGSYRSGGRQEGVAQAISLAVLGLAALAVFRVHWTRDGLALRRIPTAGAPASPEVTDVTDVTDME